MKSLCAQSRPVKRVLFWEGGVGTPHSGKEDEASHGIRSFGSP